MVSGMTRTDTSSPAFSSLSSLLEARHSCRAFRPDPIPRDTIEAIVAAAQRVPSWCNAQPWQLTIVSGTEIERFRAALYAHAAAAPPDPDLEWPKGYPGMYGDRRRACGFQLYEAVGIARGDRAASAAQMLENYRFFGAPHVAIVTTPVDLGLYGAVDCGGFVTAFTLAAQAMDVATIAQAAIAAHAPFVRDWLDLPQDRHVLCAISFGRADRDHPANAFRTDRAAPSDVITWVG